MEGEDGGLPGGAGKPERPGPSGRLREPVEDAQHLLECFSLSPSEAKTLVAMMRLGSATASQLAPVTGIDRTNLYRLLESLQNRQLVRKSPGRSSVWVAAERKEIVWRLRQREEERLRAAEAALERLDAVLEEVPEAEERAVAVVQVVDEVSAAVRYADAISSAVSELMVFNRGPYVGELSVDDHVVAAMARGVRASALWPRHELHSQEVLSCAAAYAEVGVDTRVVKELPMAMALLDRRLTLASLPGEAPGDTPYVANVVVDSRAFGGVMGSVFDRLWEQAEPFEAHLQRLRHRHRRSPADRRGKRSEPSIRSSTTQHQGEGEMT